MDRYDGLKLEHQLCFPLYACAREVIKQYTPHLEKLGLTYTQYIAMMVFWERGECSAKELGALLHLDSGTLTPVLKALEKKGLVERARSSEDERVLLVRVTAAGERLKEQAVEIPEKVAACVKLSAEEAAFLYQTLYKILDGFAPA